MPKLQDKRILVTGASKGLGAVVAPALAEQGARLVLAARTRDRLEAVRHACRFPERHLSISLNLLDMEELHTGVQRAQEFLGGIDVVLHSAGGGLGFREPLLASKEFLQLFTLNLGAVAEINRLVVPEMKTRRSGNLVHVGSIASSEGVGSVGYNTVKAGLAAYVRTLGRELAAFDVVATGILPGGFSAPGNAMERLKENNPEAYRKFVEERLPRKVMGQAREIIPILLVLCSEDASMMGGCMVPIDAAEGKAYSL